MQYGQRAYNAFSFGDLLPFVLGDEFGNCHVFPADITFWAFEVDDGDIHNDGGDTYHTADIASFSCSMSGL